MHYSAEVVGSSSTDTIPLLCLQLTEGVIFVGDEEFNSLSSVGDPVLTSFWPPLFFFLILAFHLCEVGGADVKKIEAEKERKPGQLKFFTVG